MMRRLLPALLFLLPGVLDAQAASYTYIQQKPPYFGRSSWSPDQPLALNLPRIGNTFNVQVWNSWSLSSVSVLSVLATGVTNPNIRADWLHGWLYTSAEVVTILPPSRTTTCCATVSFPIPNSSGLLGVHFYQQVYLQIFSLNGARTFWMLSRGGHGVIGR